ncbi:MAG: GNAT family N-acetyltransferase [Candidatus Dormibacteraeota bacterium]|nr:GNAT family N-acetyltransferase [Candidatus Dormibacteraeota bacterium]
MILEPLTTPRLTLTPISTELARRIVAGDLSGVRAAPGWPHADTMDGLLMSVEHGHPSGWFVIHEGAVIGDCGLYGPPDPDGNVEIGYGLAEGWRGRGLGTDVVRALADWLEVQPGVSAVRAHTLPGNLASRRVLQKAGFRELRVEHGEVLYERCSPPG